MSARCSKANSDSAGDDDRLVARFFGSSEAVCCKQSLHKECFWIRASDNVGCQVEVIQKWNGTSSYVYRFDLMMIILMSVCMVWAPIFLHSSAMRFKNVAVTLSLAPLIL